MAPPRPRTYRKHIGEVAAMSQPSQSSTSLPITPFTIQIDEAVLADLRARIHQTRWPDQIPGIGWEQGTDRDELRPAAGLLGRRVRTGGRRSAR